MTMQEVALLQKDITTMQEKICEIKGSVSSLSEEIKTIVPSITRLLKDEYVHKLEFGAYKKDTDRVFKAFVWITGVLITAFLGMLFKIVFGV